MSLTPLVILGAVIALIAVRQVGRVRFQIWQAMALGAVAMLLTGSIPPRAAIEAVDLDVILFLFGMFALGRALEASGLLADLTYRAVRRARSADALALVFLFAVAFAGAILMNDTLAVVGTPVAVHLARAHGLPPRVLLFGLMFAVTTGSVASPIGNPQNLLIALHGGMSGPFVTFLLGLGLPTLIALVLVYAVLRVAYRRDFHPHGLEHTPGAIDDRALARLSGVALAVLLVLIGVKIAWLSLGGGDGLRLTVIALIPAALVLLLSPRRIEITRGVDWPTLAFFAALFIVVAGVGRSGAVERVVEALGAGAAHPSVVLAASALLSQVVSNVPLVALYLPVLDGLEAPTQALLALAAGSTIAGNLAVLGAASNVIVIDLAERRFGVRLGFVEFMRLGVPLTALQLGVYALFLR
jgi:Na+/H+ antiporter NhaD/arsenite permease-like protein